MNGFCILCDMLTALRMSMNTKFFKYLKNSSTTLETFFGPRYKENLFRDKWAFENLFRKHEDNKNWEKLLIRKTRHKKKCTHML